MKYLSVLLASYFCASLACTGIRITTQDSAVVYARTLEWRHDLNSKALIVPRSMVHTGTSVDNKKGMTWTNKYAFVGINIFDYSFVIDGVNEDGLGAGLFSFRDNLAYHCSNPQDTSHDLAPWEFVSYLLGNFATVSQVLQGITEVKVVPVLLKETGVVEPFHYIVHDKQGNCIVLEHVDHAIKVFDNPLGVIANSPTFDWHLTNLKNYTNFGLAEFVPLQFINNKLIDLQCETNVLGLPGNFSSTSRFIKAAIFSKHVLPSATGSEGVLQAFHLLNQFDIPRGLVRSLANSNVTYTHWTSASDLAHKKYYFRTYHNQRIRMIDLAQANLDDTKITSIPMDGSEDILDVLRMFNK